MPAVGPQLAPGDVVPGTKYRVVKPLGAGGMGVVYQVVKAPSIQGVLKLMSTELTSHEEFRTRFFDEVRVLAQLDHPNIVRVFDYDSLADGTPFYVMELLHGRTVRDVLGTMGTLPPRVAFEIARQLCEALHCAHTHDIPVVHRDIKPENIFLHAPRHGEPTLKLIDFGVAGVGDRQHDGTFVGTWKYAAPEQIRGERATPATDLYAVGLVLYEMLCGLGPFEHLESGSLVSQAHLKELPAPVSKFAPWVPPTIVELIASALAKNPRQRPKDAYAFAERLFELEWANDGKDPHDRTAEGPLSRILSTVGAEPKKPSSKKLAAAAPARDRLGNVPLIGVPEASKHDGPTLRGMGGTDEGTVPDEESLLAGLMARPDMAPISKRKGGTPEPAAAAAGAAKRVTPHPAGVGAAADAGAGGAGATPGPREAATPVPLQDAESAGRRQGAFAEESDERTTAPRSSRMAAVAPAPGATPPASARWRRPGIVGAVLALAVIAGIVVARGRTSGAGADVRGNLAGTGGGGQAASGASSVSSAVVEAPAGGNASASGGAAGGGGETSGAVDARATGTGGGGATGTGKGLGRAPAGAAGRGVPPGVRAERGAKGASAGSAAPTPTPPAGAGHSSGSTAAPSGSTKPDESFVRGF